MTRLQTTGIAAALAIYSAGAFAFMLSLVPAPGPFPRIDLESRDGGQTFQVVAAEPGLQWGDFRPVGCNRRPSGAVDVGDELTGCGGVVALEYVGA